MTKSKKLFLPEKFTPPHLLSGLEKNTPILVAFSGGADSSALLSMLVSYGHSVGAKIYAAHVNHMIRGKEADDDENFCRAVADSLGVRLFVCRSDVPAYAKENSLSIETAARCVRYDFFEKVMKENSIPLLATAHNANDNLETMLFNLARGCGLSGICGIPEARPCESGTVIRPILSMSKTEIFDYCNSLSIKFVTDSTNTDTDYTRNKIRAEIIPALLEINTGAIENASRLSASLKKDSLCLESMTDWFLEEMNDDASFETKKLLGSPTAIANRALMALYRDVSVGAALEYTHIKSIRAACASENAKLNLPENIDAVVKNGRLYMIKRKASPTPPSDFETVLTNEKTLIPQINAEIIIGNSQTAKNVYKNSILLYLDSAKISGVLIARSRRAGDKIRLRGVNRSIKKLLCDLKIPLELRYRLPVLCDENGVVAVPSAAIADGYSANKNSCSVSILINLLE